MNSKKPIRSKSDIVKFFHDAVVPKKELLIGLEIERSGVYDTDLSSDVMQECQNLVKNWTFTDHLEMRENVYEHALQTETPDGGKVLDVAKELLEIAFFSLKERHREMRDRIDASRFLWSIKEYIFVREQSPAEYVMEMWNGEWHRNPRKLLEWSEK